MSNIIYAIFSIGCFDFVHLGFEGTRTFISGVQRTHFEMNREHKKKKQGNKPRYIRETMERVAPGKASLVH